MAITSPDLTTDLNPEKTGPEIQDCPFPELEQGFPDTIYVIQCTETGKHLGVQMDGGEIALRCFETAVAAEVQRSRIPEQRAKSLIVVAVTFDEAREIVKSKVPKQSLLLLLRLIDDKFIVIAQHHVRASGE